MYYFPDFDKMVQAIILHKTDINAAFKNIKADFY